LFETARETAMFVGIVRVKGLKSWPVEDESMIVAIAFEGLMARHPSVIVPDIIGIFKKDDTGNDVLAMGDTAR
jgi:hypothetical protein